VYCRARNRKAARPPIIIAAMLGSIQALVSLNG